MLSYVDPPEQLGTPAPLLRPSRHTLIGRPSDERGWEASCQAYRGVHRLVLVTNNADIPSSPRKLVLTAEAGAHRSLL